MKEIVAFASKIYGVVAEPLSNVKFGVGRPIQKGQRGGRTVKIGLATLEHQTCGGWATPTTCGG